MSFEQKLVIGKPPIYDEIVAEFPLGAQPGVLFSWGDTIYCPLPNFASLHPSLAAHEAVHGERQWGGPDTVAEEGIIDWWARYLEDPNFRFEEERLAHIAEYQWWRDHGNRNGRRAALVGIAKRLASPLYGSMIPRHKAETILRKNTHEQDRHHD